MTHKWKKLTENTFRDTLTHIIYRKEKNGKQTFNYTNTES